MNVECSSALVIGAATVVGAYACVLYRWKLQLRSNELYLNAAVRTIEIALRMRYGRVRAA